MKAFLTSVEPKLFRPTATAFCVAHGRRCLQCEPITGATGLKVEVAGTICKDVSFMHKERPGLYGRSAGPLPVWIFERRSSREDLVLTERTPAFPVAVYEELLSDLYVIRTLVAGPEDLGWHVHRRRRYCIM
eukprot:9950717-Alexandrium_andersonii.AAC.1